MGCSVVLCHSTYSHFKVCISLCFLPMFVTLHVHSHIQVPLLHHDLCCVVSLTVHEKSILLPLLPASILAWEKPFIFRWLTSFAMLSMFPLLRRDELILPYGALYGLFVILYYAPGGKLHRSETNTFYATLKSLLLVCSLILHIVYLTVTPPNRYPFLFEAIIMLLCFSQFVFIFVYSNTIQYTMLKLNSQVDNDKKNL